MRRTHLIGGLLGLALLAAGVQWGLRSGPNVVAAAPSPIVVAEAGSVELANFAFAEPVALTHDVVRVG